MPQQISIYYTGIGANNTGIHTTEEFTRIFMNNYHLFNYDPYDNEISYNYIHENILNLSLNELCYITGAEIRITNNLSN
jgi:hypothetical protein